MEFAVSRFVCKQLALDDRLGGLPLKLVALHTLGDTEFGKLGVQFADGDVLSADAGHDLTRGSRCAAGFAACDQSDGKQGQERSEEHTSELQSLMRISYAVFCLT